MYNRMIIMGRICNDLELRQTPSGVSVLTFNVAVDRKFKVNGEKVSDFFTCVAWRNEAEFIHNFFAKGNPILVEGEMQTRKYDNKDGVKMTAYEIIVDRACFTGGKSESSSNVPSGQPPIYSSVVVESDEGSGDYPF